MRDPGLKGRTILAVDRTGVGEAAIEYLEDERLAFESVNITGETMAGIHEKEPGRWYAPKPLLIGELQILLASGRLEVAQGLPFREEFKKELQSYEYKHTPAGNRYFEPRGDSEHDDIILAAAIAVQMMKRLCSLPGMPSASNGRATRPLGPFQGAGPNPFPKEPPVEHERSRS
jgi:hypothetical protein